MRNNSKFEALKFLIQHSKLANEKHLTLHSSKVQSTEIEQFLLQGLQTEKYSNEHFQSEFIQN